MSKNCTCADECTTAALCCKSVININNGVNIGNPVKFGVDVCTGRLTSLYVSVDSGLLGLIKGETVCVPWDKIMRIGTDAIIVDVACEADASACSDAGCFCRGGRGKGIIGKLFDIF